MFLDGAAFIVIKIYRNNVWTIKQISLFEGMQKVTKSSYLNWGEL